MLAQTYAPSEIIVVDDGSTDATPDVVGGYAGRGVKHVLLPDGKGAQAARNHGVSIAQNEWIAFQDSDDLWLPNKLEMQVEALRARDFDERVVVHGDGVRRDEDSGVERPQRVTYTSGRCYNDLLLRPAPLFPTIDRKSVV